VKKSYNELNQVIGYDMRQTRDYYSVLGVARNASKKDIREAYRRLARELHPDLHPDDKDAESRFKKVNEAHRVLSNEENRKKYDLYGDRWEHAEEFERAGARTGRGFGGVGPEVTFEFDPSGSSTFENLFGGLFGGSGRQAEGRSFSGFGDVETETDLSLEEAYRGASRLVEIPVGGGGGETRRLEIRIPAGVEDGARVHIATAESVGGDLYVKVRIRPHPVFRRTGMDLETDVSVPVDTLALGGDAQVPTLDGTAMLTIPPGTKNGKRFRLKGKGMPKAGQQGQRGNLYAVANALLPDRISDEEKRIFEQLRSARLARR
jgi:DnaJ-class molecular chaperone